MAIKVTALILGTNTQFKARHIEFLTRDDSLSWVELSFMVNTFRASG